VARGVPSGGYERDVLWVEASVLRDDAWDAKAAKGARAHAGAGGPSHGGGSNASQTLRACPQRELPPGGETLVAQAAQGRVGTFLIYATDAHHRTGAGDQ
jgi:hypothetical protein